LIAAASVSGYHALEESLLVGGLNTWLMQFIAKDNTHSTYNLLTGTLPNPLFAA